MLIGKQSQKIKFSLVPMVVAWVIKLVLHGVVIGLFLTNDGQETLQGSWIIVSCTITGYKLIWFVFRQYRLRQAYKQELVQTQQAAAANNTDEQKD